MLRLIGHPQFFGEEAEAGAIVKLLGQILVFNGLRGITGGIACDTVAFRDGVLSAEGQAEFFRFLNGGAGGTRQWDVAAVKGVAESVFDAGFLVAHAGPDALYAAEMARSLGLSHHWVVRPLLEAAAAFAYILKTYPDERLATHAVMRELIGDEGQRFDAFLEDIFEGCFTAGSVDVAFDKVATAFLSPVAESINLNVSAEDFEAA